MATTTILDLLQELQSFITINPLTLKDAKEADITSKNNREFRELLNDWTKGRYDESPELLAQRLTHLLRYEN